MLSSVLPGLRELRTPLSTGYLWLINAWLVCGTYLPRTREEAGAFSPVWDLASYFGKPGIAIAVSFVAYMVGSFVEIDPLRLWEHGGRPRWISWLRDLLRHRPILRRLEFFPVSAQAEKDLASYGDLSSGAGRAARGTMTAMRRIMLEEQQIATRLQAENTELFGRYDRHLAESAFRINVSLPLTTFMVLLASRSAMPAWLKILLILAALLYGAMLFRQGVARAVYSRDVIVQALIIGVVDSPTVASILPRNSREAQGLASTRIEEGDTKATDR